MNEMYFRISYIQRKIDSNHNLQTINKVIGGLMVFVIFFCSMNQSDTMRVAWMISIAFIILLFFFDVYYVKNNKKYEFEIYKLEVDALENKKKIADITGQILPDSILNREIRKPINEISLPILYYAIILTLDILTKIFMIH